MRSSRGTLTRGTGRQAALATLVALMSCRSPYGVQVPSEATVEPLRLELPAALERERGAYEDEIETALGDVSTCWLAAGLPAPDHRVIDSALVFESTVDARAYLANKYDLPIESVPETFAGTVEGRLLFLVSREAYGDTWRALYPDWPWTDREYHRLIVHELTHRAHEELAVRQHGSAEAMGPTWFFEGFAVACASQFDSDAPPLTVEELKGQLGEGRTPLVSYPLYGRLVRSLAVHYGLRTLIDRAGERDFPDGLWTSGAGSGSRRE